jgi:hypothetical protein
MFATLIIRPSAHLRLPDLWIPQVGLIFLRHTPIVV